MESSKLTTSEILCALEKPGTVLDILRYHSRPYSLAEKKHVNCALYDLERKGRVFKDQPDPKAKPIWHDSAKGLRVNVNETSAQSLEVVRSDADNDIHPKPTVDDFSHVYRVVESGNTAVSLAYALLEREAIQMADAIAPNFAVLYDRGVKQPQAKEIWVVRDPLKTINLTKSDIVYKRIIN